MFFSLGRSFFLAALTALAAITNSAFAQDVFYPGEELNYRISYLGIQLGTVKIITEGMQNVNGKTVCKTKAFMDSRPGIPFVDLHTTYESWIDKSGAFSHQFVGNAKEGEQGWVYTKYNFDYDARQMRAEVYKNKKLSSLDTVELNKKWNDGLSLFFMARHYTATKKNYRVPTIIEGDTVKTTINFVGRQEMVDIDAVNYPIKTVYLNGIADWTGVYGLSGKFEGWFSDDEARIPIIAKMKVYLGSVDIELVSWKRGSWQPPQSRDAAENR